VRSLFRELKRDLEAQEPTIDLICEISTTSAKFLDLTIMLTRGEEDTAQERCMRF